MERLSNSVSTVTQLWKRVNIRTPEAGDDTFSETLVRNNATVRYKGPEDIFDSVRMLERRVLRKIIWTEEG
jgi:hypothetical protein